MSISHYYYLYPAYFIAILGWYFYQKYIITNPDSYDINEDQNIVNFKNPKLEFFYSLIAVIGILMMGQLFVHGYLFKSGFLTNVLNQILIFSPIFLLLPIRGHSMGTALIPQKGKLRSIGVGFLLAVLALIVFLGLKGHNFKGMAQAFSDIYLSKDNLDALVQVFAEDFAISVLLFRLVRWLGLTKSVVVVAFLFAAGHIPAMISNGVEISQFVGLLLDLLLGVLVLKTVYKSSNFLWFWMIHFTMDMTQFL